MKRKFVEYYEYKLNYLKISKAHTNMLVCATFLFFIFYWFLVILFFSRIDDVLEICMHMLAAVRTINIYAYVP